MEARIGESVMEKELTVGFSISVLVIVPYICWWLEMQLADIQTTCNAGHWIVTIVTKITCFGPHCNIEEQNRINFNLVVQFKSADA